MILIWFKNYFYWLIRFKTTFNKSIEFFYILYVIKVHSKGKRSWSYEGHPRMMYGYFLDVPVLSLSMDMSYFTILGQVLYNGTHLFSAPTTLSTLTIVRLTPWPTTVAIAVVSYPRCHNHDVIGPRHHLRKLYSIQYYNWISTTRKYYI